MGARILIIDDEELFRSMLVRILENEGYEVLEAVNGSDGVKIFNSEKPDLTVTDLIMPVKEGLETIKELKDANPDAKIIAMSGGGAAKGQDYLEMARVMGAVFSLEKPFERAEFLSAVNEVLVN